MLPLTITLSYCVCYRQVFPSVGQHTKGSRAGHNNEDDDGDDEQLSTKEPVSKRKRTSKGGHAEEGGDADQDTPVDVPFCDATYADAYEDAIDE
jgi:hypothetical protein